MKPKYRDFYDFWNSFYHSMADNINLSHDVWNMAVIETNLWANERLPKSRIGKFILRIIKKLEARHD